MKNIQHFYPILLGMYSGLALISVNIDQMLIADGARSILLAALFSALVFALFSWRIKDQDKASFLSAVFLVFFFAYGHVYDALEGFQIGGLTLGRHRYLLPLWMLALAGLSLWIARRHWKLATFRSYFFTVSLILCAMPVVQIGMYEWGRYRPAGQPGDGQSLSNPSQNPSLAAGYQPDIYYIILDGYPRQDALLKYSDFDNQYFADQLQTLGFSLPACTQSNYAMTILSLSSAMNMNYVDALGNVEHINLEGKIINSELRQFLEELGYQTVALESSIWFTDFQDADHYVSQQRPVLNSFFDLTRLSDFEVFYLRTTLLRPLEEAKTAWLDALFAQPRQDLYDLIMFQLEQLERVPQIKGPKFVFAHILAPHAREAYFNAQGEFAYSRSNEALNEEFQYLNQKILQIVQTILADSQNPPVIILQADHGLDNEARMAILNAYYLPGDGAKLLYPTITPVNSFRIVLNAYFGQDYELLPDISRYSPYEDMFNFTEVRYPCNP